MAEGMGILLTMNPHSLFLKPWQSGFVDRGQAPHKGWDALYSASMARLTHIRVAPGVSWVEVPEADIAAVEDGVAAWAAEIGFAIRIEPGQPEVEADDS